MARLEIHQQQKHRDTSLCCPVCGMSKDSARQLQRHQRAHKTTSCPKCDKALTLNNKSRHIKTCQGNGVKLYQCDQCEAATKTPKGIKSHKIKFHEAPSVENKTLFECGYCNFKSKRKHSRDIHEKDWCQEKLRQQQGPVEPLYKEDVLEWFGDLNITKEAMESILEKISRKWGKHFLEKGVKVS